MKKTLTFILVIVICLALGYLIGMGIDYMMGDKIDGEPIDRMKLFKAIIIAFVALIVSFISQTVLHEAGHLAGGLMTGYKYLSFRIFSYTLQKEDDGLHWKKFNIAGTVGQCLMCPPDNQDVPYFWYNAGGVLVNLILCIFAGVMLYMNDLSAIPFSFCIMTLLTGIYLLLMNAIPMKIGGVPNDGMNLLILWRHPEQRKHFHNMMAVAAEQSRGTRPKDMPENWFESEPVNQNSTIMEISGRNLYYARLMDQFRFDEARVVTEEMMKIDKQMPGLYRMEVAGDRVLLELATLNRMEIVNELWNKKDNQIVLSKYVKTYSKYIPMKCAILYSYELINNQNPETAQVYYDEVKKKQDTYTQKGEALMALAIMDRLKDKYQLTINS